MHIHACALALLFSLTRSSRVAGHAHKAGGKGRDEELFVPGLRVLQGAAGARPATATLPRFQAPPRGPQMMFGVLPKPDAAAEQAQKTTEQGMSPEEWANACRNAARDHLETVGAHVAAADLSLPPQTAEFTKLLWGVDSIPAVPPEAASDPSRVLATVYEIGGPLTNVLSTSVSKQLPLIPHVGIRVHGVEYFYSDHIEVRTVPVMEQMLGDKPQVTLDLGPSSLSKEEVEQIVASLDADWEAKDYDVFNKNCVHFADLLGAKVTQSGVGVPPVLMRGVLDISERMLDSLPEWRRALGQRMMTQVTRLVITSWGRASKEKKEATADKLGLDRGQ